MCFEQLKVGWALAQQYKLALHLSWAKAQPTKNKLSVSINLGNSTRGVFARFGQLILAITTI